MACILKINAPIENELFYIWNTNKNHDVFGQKLRIWICSALNNVANDWGSSTEKQIQTHKRDSKVSEDSKIIIHKNSSRAIM